jgi:hypothetical protein
MAVAAVLLMLPSLLWGTLPSHSSLHNLTWAAQFADQMSFLTPYPRWLYQSFDGLGAPTFYFYPPLAFWVDGLLKVVTLDAMSTSWRLSVTAALLLWASGLAMQRWLLLESVDRRTALIAALAYMAAPYHLTDHYIRGALAEFAAYAPLPFVMVGVALVAQRRRWSLVVLAAAYAALVMAHLPTALLISLTAIPAYVLFLAWRNRDTDHRFLLRCGLGFGFGLGLAAPYLVPALTLQDFVLIEWMWRYGFQVDQGFLLFPGRWVQPPYMFTIILSIAGGWLLAALSLFQARTPETRLWAAIGLAALLVMSGLVPWIWHIPPISKVGFPWRLLIVVEFAVITALALGPWPARQRIPRLVLWLAVAAFIPGAAELVAGTTGRVELAKTGEVPPLQDAREYLPKGYPQQPDAGYADLNLEPARAHPTIACRSPTRECRAEVKRSGIGIFIDGDNPTRVVVRRFAFPSWQLEPPLPLMTSEPLRLVSFEVPAGRHTYWLGQRTLASEQWGWALGAGSLVFLLLATWRMAREDPQRGS